MHIGFDSVFIILGTLAILVGGTLLINSTDVDNTRIWGFYVSGSILIVLGIIANAIVVAKTNLKIRTLEEKVSKLEKGPK